MNPFKRYWSTFRTKQTLRRQSDTPRIPWVTVILSIVLILIYYWQTKDPQITTMWSTGEILTLLQHQYYQLITANWIHQSWSHVLGNVFGLLLIGWRFERLIGHWRFLIIYLVAGLTSTIFSLSFHQGVLGASGSIVGIMVAALVLYLRFFRNSLVKAFTTWWQVVVILIEILAVGIGLFNIGYTNTNDLAHTGGIIGAVLTLWLLNPPLQVGKYRTVTRISAAVLLMALFGVSIAVLLNF
ncbi:rhomboid family intramembrane serine protease [Periweissella cryptocerci]|uniref:Rhomboid family intramembrane serine protease n=1 Tax=Periweissella cryptocerci TaxID=2506420 RepID=A0A4P6YSZ5_9LACO|nr:rhomboid family intramembrane serine protease [Periweissella cryptocerci]QBO35854.1 rhomboid family intramembrane serine protease [Periweissella cryptocerci]